MKKAVIYTSVLALTALILIFPDNAIAYARSSMDICREMIIPTLFPFFVCSGILISSGFCDTLARLFRFCMRPLFNVSPAGAAAFVLGIVSGYPLGAVTAGQLYEEGYISKTEAQRLCAFCSNSGPLFIIGSVGTAMYSDIGTGVMLYAVHILAAVTVGIIFRFYGQSSPDTELRHSARQGIGTAELISSSLGSAVKTMLTVCAAVVFFGTAGRLLTDLLPLDGVLYAVAAGLIEFVNGTLCVSQLNIGAAEKLVMTAFIVGFAGMSVHAQVIAVIAKYGFSLFPYFAGKILHGITAALYTYLYLKLLPPAQTVFSPDIGRAFCACASCVSMASVSLICAGAAVYARRIHKILSKEVKE